MRTTTRVSAALCWGAFVVAASAQTIHTIGFDRDVYQITPGQTFLVTVAIEPSSLSGLFSYAVRLNMDDLRARVSGAAGISVPAALGFNGVEGAGALKAVGTGFAAVKGTVDFFASPVVYYSGSQLAIFTLTDRSATFGQYTLSLEGYNTLGPTESLFVDGAGTVLDKSITFGTATVNVVPEPSVVLLALFGGLVAVLARRAGHAPQRCPPEGRGADLAA